MQPDARRLLFLQVMLGVLTLCIAMGQPWLVVAAVSLGLFGWWWFEHVLHRRLPGWMVTTGGLLALLILLIEHFVLKQRMVVAMAHFTLLLQGLLVFGHRRPRDTIAMIAISLIQVILACVVSVSMIFGLLMIGYCLLLTWTLSRLQIEVAVSDRYREGIPNPHNHLRLPIPLRLLIFAVVFLCLSVGLTCFVLMPRSEQGSLTSRINSTLKESSSGYNERVDVTTSPEFEGSDEAVLQLRVTSHGESFRGAGQVYLLRGMVFDQYDPTSHQWLRGVDAQARYQRIKMEMGQALLAKVDSISGMLEGQIVLRRRVQESLFTVLPTISVASPNLDKIEFNPLDQVVRSSHSGAPGGALAYRIYWPFFQRIEVPGAYFDQLDESPSVNRLTRIFSERQTHRYARGWPMDTDQIRGMAMEILKREGLSRDPDALHDDADLQIANALATELRNNFRYMRFNPRPNEELDPVTDFLINHHTGHCELFASGLAALCRSVGIPSRLVVGYRVSEYNPDGEYYVAREKHAHAWVEVAIEPMAGWRPLDATPESALEEFHAEEQSILHRIRAYYEHLEFAWIGSIVVYDERARDLMVSWARNIPLAAADIATALQSIYQEVATWFALMTGSSLALWGGISMTLFGIAVGLLARLMMRDKASLGLLGVEESHWLENRRQIRQMRFYLKMIAMLRAHGYVRPTWQTPRAFAEELSDANPMRFGPVVALTDLFYAVRFGQASLNPTDLTRAHAHLSALSDALGMRAPRL